MGLAASAASWISSLESSYSNAFSLDLVVGPPPGRHSLRLTGSRSKLRSRAGERTNLEGCCDTGACSAAAAAASASSASRRRRASSSACRRAGAGLNPGAGEGEEGDGAARRGANAKEVGLAPSRVTAG